MTKDEITVLAVRYARGFCRDHKVDTQEISDYIQEGVLGALEYVVGKEVITKALIHTVVNGVLLNYGKKQRNEGFGGRDASGPEHVSLAEPVGPGAVDDDGIPITYGDLLVYPDPPEGFGDPGTEYEREHNMSRLGLAIKALSQEDQEFVQVAMLSDLTQEEAAAKLGITQPTVHRKIEQMVRKLQSIML